MCILLEPGMLQFQALPMMIVKWHVWHIEPAVKNKWDSEHIYVR